MSSNHQEPQQSSDDLGVGAEYDEPNELRRTMTGPGGAGAS